MHLFRTRTIKIIIISIAINMLSACGGGNDDSPPASTSNRLFVHDGVSMVSVANVNSTIGTIVLDTVVTGSNTSFGNVDDYALDIKNDRLYVSNGSSILVFDKVSITNGNVAPSRIITSSSFGAISHLFLDTANNLLYASDDLVGMWVIGNASNANGNITPVRGISGIIAGYSSFSIQGIAIDIGNDVMYLSFRPLGPYQELILSFNNASVLNGTNVSADRIFTSNNTGGNPGQIVLDTANDILYMSDSGSYAIKVFENVSTTSGTVNPSRTISLGESISDVKLDSANNRLYASSVSNIFVIENASTANGNVKTKKIQMPNTFPSLNAIAVAP